MKTKALIVAAVLCTFAFVLYGCGNMGRGDDTTDSGKPSVSLTDDVANGTEDPVSRETDELPVTTPNTTDAVTTAPATSAVTTDAVTTTPVDTTAPVTTAPVTQPPLPPESK
ncbi:MAG: hypothetical protein IKM27_03590 [Clostridia bacterium]|nr:hypothetical protein [Clostridia bacterium]